MDETARKLDVLYYMLYLSTYIPLKYSKLTDDIMETQTKMKIEISKELFDKVQQRVKAFNDEFKSVEEYIAFVLEEVVKEEQEQGRSYTEEEEEEIKNRLKNLGYL